MENEKYTKEQIAWLREFAPGRFQADILIAFNEHFGLDISPSQLHSLMGNYGIRNGKRWMQRPESHPRLTTDEMDQAVMAEFHHKGEGSYRAVQSFLQGKFGLVLSLKQIKGYASRIGLCMQVYGYFPKGHVPANKGKHLSPEVYAKCQPTMFKKGHIPENWLPVGSERVNVDGYTEVKIADPNVWALKHRLIYEEATGEKLKSKEAIVFLDGDKTNLAPENLAKVSQADLARLNQSHLLTSDPEFTKLGVALAKLMTATAKRAKRERGGKL